MAADPSGFLFARFDDWRLVWIRRFATFMVRLNARLRGIRIGKGTAFYGRTHFRRAYGSSIIIGTSCRFRSSFISNMVGLNRPCFLSTLESGAELIIGSNAGFSGTVIGCASRITIGRNVLCGGNTFITDYDWHPLDRQNPAARPGAAPVVIEDDVWLGLNVIVLKGVTIGRGSVIGANSVVTRDIPAGVIAGGNPCRVLKNLNEA